MTRRNRREAAWQRRQQNLHDRRARIRDDQSEGPLHVFETSMEPISADETVITPNILQGYAVQSRLSDDIMNRLDEALFADSALCNDLLYGTDRGGQEFSGLQSIARNVQVPENEATLAQRLNDMREALMRERVQRVERDLNRALSTGRNEQNFFGIPMITLDSLPENEMYAVAPRRRENVGDAARIRNAVSGSLLTARDLASTYESVLRAAGVVASRMQSSQPVNVTMPGGRRVTLPTNGENINMLGSGNTSSNEDQEAISLLREMVGFYLMRSTGRMVSQIQIDRNIADQSFDVNVRLSIRDSDIESAEQTLGSALYQQAEADMHQKAALAKVIRKMDQTDYGKEAIDKCISDNPKMVGYVQELRKNGYSFDNTKMQTATVDLATMTGLGDDKQEVQAGRRRIRMPKKTNNG